MPGATNQRKPIVDTDPPHPALQDDGDDASGNRFAVDPLKSSRTAEGKHPPSISLSDDIDASSPGEGEIANTQLGKASLAFKDSLRVPGTKAPPKPPAENSIWDWDTPLGSVGDSSSQYYEPQGELLFEQHETHRSRSEFTIPQAGPASDLDWSSFPRPAQTGKDGFAIPRRPTSTIAGSLKRKSTADGIPHSPKQPESKRASRSMSQTGGEESIPSADSRPVPPSTKSQGAAAQTTRARSATDAADSRARSSVGIDSAQAHAASSTANRTHSNTTASMVLPPRKVFPIQCGDKLFRVSGASISSDAPSYFTQFFEDQLRKTEGADNVQTLYIDRDPATLEDIVRHLQGYHIEPRDGRHFVKLFADAQFFGRHAEFQIPRDIFNSPGDSPNYFSLGFAAFFSTPSDVSLELSQRATVRPPSILPPSVPNRSAKTFADLLHILKGYPLDIRSEEHRQELLRDARYYHLKGLEQRIIPHSITYNLARKKSEILIRLDDIRQSGISYIADAAAGATSAPSSPASSTTSSVPTGPGWIYYQRPYVDSEAHMLIIEMGGDESTVLAVGPGSSTSPARLARAMFHGTILTRITKLFSVIANKMNLPVTQPLGLMLMERGAGVASLPVSPRNTGVSDERVKVRIGPDADVTVDGKNWRIRGDVAQDESNSAMETSSDEGQRGPRQHRSVIRSDEEEEWILQKAQWRLRIQPVSSGAQNGRSGMEVVLGAVKIQAYRTERGRNSARGFLT